MAVVPEKALDALLAAPAEAAGFTVRPITLGMAAVLQKVLNMDASSCDPLKVLEMACVGGARAMGLYDCDDIAEGKKADLIVLDLSRPNMQPIHNIPKNIVYAGSKENVRLTMVNGTVRYEDGIFHIGEEPEQIYRNAQKLVKEVL